MNFVQCANPNCRLSLPRNYLRPEIVLMNGRKVTALFCSKCYEEIQKQKQELIKRKNEQQQT